MKTKKINIDEPHNNLARFQKKICTWALTGAIVAGVLFLFLNERAMAKGLVLGALFSIINFILLGKSIPMTLGQSRPRATLIGLSSIFLRYVLMAIPMIVALKSESFNFVAVVAGLFAIQIATVFDYFVIGSIKEGK